MVSVRLDDETDARLARLAKNNKRTKSSYIKEALDKFLEDQEETEYAIAAYRQYLDGDRKTYSYEEVMRENGLLDENS
ncbi:MAG: ribbon-helix-helix protein, CopG family [Flavobacteriales bacterium]|nr:ribbon-helix-helix protein, CopG family [Flavobacteriales bacterium]